MDALRYARDLVAFESTSVLSNVDVSNYVERTLRELAFETERIEYDDERGVRKVSIVGRKGRPGSGGLAYFGHTDVVPADPWFSKEHGPFTPTVKDGRLYGRGSCDMKGSVACALAAAARFSSGDLQRPLYITCTCDEEIGYGGARAVAQRSQLFREMVSGDANGVIGEPTKLEVVHAHKGTYGFMAVARGKAAHSSTKEGLNANLAMIPFLAEMKAHPRRAAERSASLPATRSFDPPTAGWNIGINDHTKAVNITPPQSVCTVYFRPMPGFDADALLDRARFAAQRHGLEFTVRVRAQPLYIDPESPFIREVLEVSGKPTPRTVSYGTDGAMLQDLPKLVVLGPGDIAQAHTFDEWIALDQLKAGTELYARLIRHWCA